MGPQPIASTLTKPMIAIDEEPVENPPIPSKSHSHMMCLRALTASVPTSVPIGIQNNQFACFAVDPKSIVLGKDPWEDTINPTYDQIIGFGRSALDIAGLIRRGQYGMEGLFNQSKACIA